TLSYILYEYRKAVAFYVDYIWNNKIEYPTKYGIKILDIKNHKYDCPKFFTIKEYKSPLSERLIKNASTQACSIVVRALSKHKRCLFVLNKSKENKD
ncbi:hypothetical protein, partial [Acinetobacter guillouiae]|uniref:hypothetical protein n=1 Tax=Acinetobacter guillouiae TaxID=106649 RepID=UPI003AF98741